MGQCFWRSLGRERVLPHRPSEVIKTSRKGNTYDIARRPPRGLGECAGIELTREVQEGGDTDMTMGRGRGG